MKKIILRDYREMMQHLFMYRRMDIRRVRKSWPEQLRKYESQGKILDGRNSYSKTDNDATFMRRRLWLRALNGKERAKDGPSSGPGDGRGPLPATEGARAELLR